MTGDERQQLEWRWVDVPECVECGRKWLNPWNRWRAYLTDDEPAQVVVYCPQCARAEFDT